MGGASVPDGKSARGKLDFELNLVPLIDLLSCCISFLIITAAWTQLARIETSQRVEGGAGGAASEPEDKVQLVVFDWGYELLRPGETESCTLPKRDGHYDRKGLRQQLASMKSKRPNLSIAAVAAVDEMDFVEVVGVMDVMVDAGVINVSLGQVPGERAQGTPCGGG